MSKYLLFVLFFAFSVAAIAQEQLAHKKRFYVNENGRFFTQKDLPMYLRLSNSPDPNAESHLVRSESSPQYSNPFYFDTEGYNTLRTPSQVDTTTKKVILPKQDIIFEIYTDGTPPQLKFSYGTKDVFVKDNVTYCGKNTKLELSATDDLAGVEAIYTSTDGQAYTKYTNVIDCNTEKNYKFKYYSADNVGNFNEPTTKEFVVDISSPKTTISIDGDKYNDILANNCTLALAATDNASGVKKVYYQIDEGPKNIYFSAVKVNIYKEGEHTITFFSIDNVNNEETPQTYTFYVDKTAPMVLEEIIGDQFVINGKEFSSGRTKLKLTAIDNKAGVREIMYSVTKGTYEKYSEPFYLPKQQGSLSVTFYAVDNVGNKSGGTQQSGGLSTYIVDLTGSTMGHSYVGENHIINDTVFINKNTKVKLDNFDKESGANKTTYNIDGSEEVLYESPFTVSTQGLHTITYTGYDNVNNTTIAKFFFIVDDKGPDVYNRFGIVAIDKKVIDGKSYDVYPLNTVLYLSATDQLVGVKDIYYSLNGTKETKYNMYVLGFKAATLYNMKMRAVDILGNETISTFDFYIE